jgi:hypothetical protein
MRRVAATTVNVHFQNGVLSRRGGAVSGAHIGSRWARQMERSVLSPRQHPSKGRQIAAVENVIVYEERRQTCCKTNRFKD